MELARSIAMNLNLVDTTAGLVDALTGGAAYVAVSGTLLDVPPLTLAPGQSVRGVSGRDQLCFAPGVDGIAVTSDNHIEGLSIATDAARRCIYASEHFREPSRGRISLVDLHVTGQIQFTSGSTSQALDLRLMRLHIARADMRARLHCEYGGGSACVQGALTVWNHSPQSSEWQLTIDQLSVGGAPTREVMGSGVLIAGHGQRGAGRVCVDAASLGAIQIDSGLEQDSYPTVCGCVFIAPGVEVKSLRSTGLQESFGANAAAIDNRGTIVAWVIEGDIRTHGANAAALLNAGRLGVLDVRGRIDTHGHGARGCEISGPVGELRMRALCTRGDASVGIQILGRLNSLRVRDGIEIRGKSGQALMNGRTVHLSADGVHVQPGGHLGHTDIAYISLADINARGIRYDDRALTRTFVH